MTCCGPSASRSAVGLHLRIESATEHKLVFTVTEREWARYFRERHPQVGYLMACSELDVGPCGQRVSPFSLSVRSISQGFRGIEPLAP